MEANDRASLATLAVWGGEEESLVQGATQVPVVYSAAYGYPDVDEWLVTRVDRQVPFALFAPPKGELL